MESSREQEEANEKYNYVHFSELEYLCFEGGGGKGTGYQGVVRALEDTLASEFVARHPKKGELYTKYPKGVPVFPLLLKPSERKFKGVRGTSAGAITAFLLSLGLNLRQIQDIFEKTIDAKVDKEYFASEHIPINRFEGFLGRQDQFWLRSVVKNKPTRQLHDARPHWLAMVLGAFAPVWRIIKAVVGSAKDPLYFKQRLFSHTSGMGTTAEYFSSLIRNRGFFSGFEVRDLYTTLIKEHLLDKLAELEIDLTDGNYPDGLSEDERKQLDVLKKDIREKISAGNRYGELTFREHYFLTGVNLVICSTNMTRGRTFYFSAYHTPNFPVIEAVGMSMSFPFAFKPVFVNTDVIDGYVLGNRQLDKNVFMYYREYNDAIRGLYVDGGVLHNFPLHAFDHTLTLREIKDKEGLFIRTYREPEKTDLRLSNHVPFGAYRFKRWVVGFNLRSSEPYLKLTERDLFPRKAGNILPWLSDLGDTFMFPGSDGTVRSLAEYQQVIDVDIFIPNPNFKPRTNDELDEMETKKRNEANRQRKNLYAIDLFDFAPPKVDEMRKMYERARNKQAVLDNIYKRVHDILMKRKENRSFREKAK